MKDYLNQDETNEFMIMGITLDAVHKTLGLDDKGSPFKRIQGLREDWIKRGNMTPEEHKNLKSAETFLSKFWLSVFNRLSSNQQETLKKKLSKFTFRIMDDYTMKKIYGELYKEMETVKLDRETFSTWCENLMEVNCKGCTKHHGNCDLHRIFDENLIPESTWGLQNCRYAYSKEDDK